LDYKSLIGTVSPWRWSIWNRNILQVYWFKYTIVYWNICVFVRIFFI